MKYTYRMENFILFDCVGMERHLEKMAAQGWELETIGRFFWKYRKTEPQKLTYSITYAPDASMYDPVPTEDQQMLTDFCTAAGWRKVGDLAQLQVFVSDKPNPTPIETDETIRLEIIRKTMKKNFVVGHGLIAVVFLMNLLLHLWNMVQYPLSHLADSSWFNSMTMMTFGALTVLADVLYYLHWVKKAEKRVADGEPLPDAGFYRTMAKICWIVLFLLFFNMLLNQLNMAAFTVLYLIGMVFIFAAVLATQKHMKKKGASKQKNFVVTLIVDCVLVIALIGGLTYLTIDMNLFRNDPPGHYSVDGRFDYPLWQDELPLYISDLTDEDKDYPHYSYKNDTDETLIMKAEICSQDTPPDGEDHPEFRYEIYTVKMGVFYDYIFNAVMEDEFRHYSEEGRAMSGYVPLNAEDWNADAVYQLKIGDPGGVIMEDQWIICKGRTIVLFRPYFEITDSMKPIITEKLFA